jgi:hypothetical protein
MYCTQAAVQNAGMDVEIIDSYAMIERRDRKVART